MHYELCIMHYALKKGHLKPQSGGKPQPWVITHGRQTNHMEPRSGDITQPWVTTHGFITAQGGKTIVSEALTLCHIIIMHYAL